LDKVLDDDVWDKLGKALEVEFELGQALEYELEQALE